MRTSWWRTLAVSLAFLLALACTFLFAYRAGSHARHFRSLAEPIRPWMSVPFVAHSHHVPAALLYQAIGVQPREPRDHRSIRHIAHDLNRPVPDLIAQLQRAIDSAAQTPGGPPQ